MRSHWCGELRAEQAGETVRLAGWIHRRRDHGGVIFIDLRDREGIVQVVADPEDSKEAHQAADGVRPEFVVAVTGKVQKRPEGAENPGLPTGEIEVMASRIEIVAEAETTPFVIEDGVDASEEMRIRYRYLDLRRPEVLALIRLRNRVVRSIRAHFDEHGFIEIETPLITKATPEGARDFLVPSRMQPERFWALPQSPQLFKQLLMIGGIDRYYQIARCMRDEDPRADRHIEFTQLDMEMSFTDEEEIMAITEGMFARIWRDVLDVELSLPFVRLSFDDAVGRYGNDKPDLRFGLEMADVSEVFASTELRIFRSVLEEDGIAAALCVPGASGLSRKELDALVVEARNLGAGGLAWVALEAGGHSSPLGKTLSDEEVRGLAEATSAAAGDLILVVCDRRGTAEAALGAVRLKVAGMLGLRKDRDAWDPEAWKFAWVVEPPLVEWNADESRWDAVHHPFTAPKEEHEEMITSDPAAVRARAYDIVLNGWEVGGGSIRIHRPELQRKIFELIGLSDEEAERRFGWFLKAFDYGAPPHGGIAPGVDRIVARIAGLDNIRGVIAFPKTGAYTDPLTGAPDAVAEETLRDLHLTIAPPE